jgi:adenylate kinase family enzyme
MPKIELLIGMIGSGKSTYARRRARDGALVVCHDDLTAMLHAEYRYEQGLRESYRRMEEALVREAVLVGRDAVIDRTHLTRESRARWIGSVRNFMLPGEVWENDPPRLIAITFPNRSPEEHARRRHTADARGRSYEEWLSVARHHAEQACAEPFDWEAERFDDWKSIDVPPWPVGLSEQTADYLARQP